MRGGARVTVSVTPDESLWSCFHLLLFHPICFVLIRICVFSLGSSHYHCLGSRYLLSSVRYFLFCREFIHSERGRLVYTLCSAAKW